MTICKLCRKDGAGLVTKLHNECRDEYVRRDASGLCFNCGVKPRQADHDWCDICDVEYSGGLT